MADRDEFKLRYHAAHALGVTFGEKMMSGFGEAEVLSFHATKFINSFEDGAVASNDSELADRIRLWSTL